MKSKILPEESIKQDFLLQLLQSCLIFSFCKKKK